MVLERRPSCLTVHVQSAVLNDASVSKMSFVWENRSNSHYHDIYYIHKTWKRLKGNKCIWKIALRVFPFSKWQAWWAAEAAVLPVS